MGRCVSMASFRAEYPGLNEMENRQRIVALVNEEVSEESDWGGGLYHHIRWLSAAPLAK